VELSCNNTELSENNLGLLRWICRRTVRQIEMIQSIHLSSRGHLPRSDDTARHYSRFCRSAVTLNSDRLCFARRQTKTRPSADDIQPRDVVTVVCVSRIWNGRTGMAGILRTLREISGNGDMLRKYRGVCTERLTPLWTDSTDSPDCLPILLSVPEFYFLVFLFFSPLFTALWYASATV